MPRVFLLVLDSFGIGGAPDAAAYGDEGSNTLGHIADQRAVEDSNKKPLHLPWLEQLGLGLATKQACGKLPNGFEHCPDIIGFHACASEVSAGKDTPSGHWEIAGLPVRTRWHCFPDTDPAFPEALTKAIIERGKIPGVLGNRHASGTRILEELGEAHIRTGMPICYTSNDSVFQIAAHETHFGLERLYALCETVFELTTPLRVARVIARPFTGESADDFTRTGNRRDFAMPPPGETLLDRANAAGHDVFAVGKISDIFAHRGITQSLKAHGNAEVAEAVLDAMDRLSPGGLLMANFVDFDTLYGHRRDVEGYARALEAFDGLLPRFFEKLRPDDVLILTADHGCDPTWQGTDHTREQVPVLVYGKCVKPGSGGTLNSFADIGATIGDILDIGTGVFGKSFASELQPPSNS